MTTTATGEEDKSCEFIDRCPMFPHFRSQAALNVYKGVFCEGRFNDCARYKLASKGEVPPIELLPDGTRLPEHWTSSDDEKSGDVAREAADDCASRTT